MTTNDDILRAIGDVQGDVKALTAVIDTNRKHDDQTHKRLDSRLMNHGERIHASEKQMDRHLGRHAQTRVIVASLSGVVALGSALWAALKSGITTPGGTP